MIDAPGSTTLRRWTAAQQHTSTTSTSSAGRGAVARHPSGSVASGPETRRLPLGRHDSSHLRRVTSHRAGRTQHRHVDGMALGVYQAIAEACLRIPDDISVVGFDDLPGSRWMIPKLTTVRQSLIGMAAAATHLLLALARGEAPAGRRPGDRGF